MNTKEIIEQLEKMSSPIWDKMISATYYAGICDLVFAAILFGIVCLVFFLNYKFYQWIESQDHKYHDEEFWMPSIIAAFFNMLCLGYSLGYLRLGMLAIISPESVVIKTIFSKIG